MARSGARYTTETIAGLKHITSPEQLLDILRVWDPDVSAGIWNLVRTAESGFTIIGYGKDGRPNRRVQRKIDEVVSRLELPYVQGKFVNRLSIEQLATQMLLYSFFRGAVATELVVGPDYRAQEFVSIDPPRVQFKEAGNGQHVPYMFKQDAQRGEVSLDIPTFVWEILDPIADSPWEQPALLSAINVILFRIAVFEDLQRVVKRIAYPRISIKLVEETLQANMPPEVQNDPDEARAWLKARKTEIAKELESLSPEDALIMYDSVEVSMLEAGKNPTVDFRPLVQVLDQQIVSALKSLPTILGRSFSSSQTLSATESLLYIKGAMGVQKPVARALSRLLTMALWLEGVQGFVRFKWKAIELRPLSELETYRSLRQSRVYELLSYGNITDEEAQEELTGSPYLPDGYVNLSGTRFRDKDMGMGDRDRVAAEDEEGTGNDPRARERTGGGRSPRGDSTPRTAR